LQNVDLSISNNHAYRPWFENGAWQGDLIEYDLATDGTRTTDASVGSNPPLASGNNWMARTVFAARENPSGDGMTFTTYWQDGASGRNIFTVGSTGSQADFLWSNLSDAQKTTLDPDTFLLGTNGAYDSPILNFVRGDRSNEKGQGGTQTATACSAISLTPTRSTSGHRRKPSPFPATRPSGKASRPAPAASPWAPMAACCMCSMQLMAPRCMPTYRPCCSASSMR
jgi:hypothetical protein